MARRKAQGPALYELIRPVMAEARPPRSRARVRPPPAAPLRPDPADAPDAAGLPRWLAWLSGGRVLRLRAAHLLLVAAGAGVLLVAAYVLGYGRAQRWDTPGSAWAPMAQRSSAVLPGQGQGAAGAAPPGAAPGEMVPAGRQGRGVPTGGTDRGGPAASPGEAAARGPAARTEPPLELDPRRAGLSYFVVAETRPEGARRLGQFCRRHGVEAYVICTTGGLCKVVVAPGFEPSQRSSPQVKALEQRIHEVGALWKGTERGASDLRDAYPSQFNPRTAPPSRPP